MNDTQVPLLDSEILVKRKLQLEIAKLQSDSAKAEDERAKLQAERKKIEAETELIQRPLIDLKGVLIPVIGALIGLAAFVKAELINRQNDTDRLKLTEQRDQLQVVNAKLKAEAREIRAAAVNRGVDQGAVVVEAQQLDAILARLNAIHSSVEAGTSLAKSSLQTEIVYSGSPTYNDGNVGSPTYASGSWNTSGWGTTFDYNYDPVNCKGGSPPINLYIIAKNAQVHSLWVNRAQKLIDQCVYLRSIEVAGVNAMHGNELRYFHNTEDDKTAANFTKSVLKTFAGTEPSIRYVKGYEAKVKSRSFELWAEQ